MARIVSLGLGGTDNQFLLFGMGGIPEPQQGSYVTQGFGETAAKFLLLGLTPQVAGTTPSNAAQQHEKLKPEYYLMTVAEITEVTDTTNIFVWEESAYERGKVYG